MRKFLSFFLLLCIVAISSSYVSAGDFSSYDTMNLILYNNFGADYEKSDVFYSDNNNWEKMGINNGSEKVILREGNIDDKFSYKDYYFKNEASNKYVYADKSYKYHSYYKVDVNMTSISIEGDSKNITHGVSGSIAYKIYNVSHAGIELKYEHELEWINSVSNGTILHVSLSEGVENCIYDLYMQKIYSYVYREIRTMSGELVKVGIHGFWKNSIFYIPQYYCGISSLLFFKSTDVVNDRIKFAVYPKC